MGMLLASNIPYPIPKRSPAHTTAAKLSPTPISTSEGIVRPIPMALVYMRPRRLVCTQRSESIPPKITPKNEDTAMVIVEMGPASDMGMLRLSAYNVGNQFFVAQPGRLDDAKKKSITQKAMLLNNSASPLVIL